MPGVRHINYFYPRSPCGERLVNGGVLLSSFGISIHALLAESDYRAPPYNLMIQHISIHALLAESDSSSVNVSASGSTFLSTLSLRRATVTRLPRAQVSPDNFYPRSPCGERPDKHAQQPTQQGISIHALLAESDRERSK